MSYLVMECHPGYAVVLDSQGRFLRVANRNYQVGQRVQEVMELQSAEQKKPARLYLRLAVAAACLCLILFGCWQMFLNPYGSVRMQINPDMNIIVNRLDQVIRVEAINEDAKVFLNGYEPDFRKIDAVTDELADRARKMGYLKSDGQIHLTVESTHENWKIATQDRLIAELKVHIGGTVAVVPETKPQAPTEPAVPTESTAPTEPSVTQPTQPPTAITMAEAKAIVFAHLGVTEGQLTDTEFTYEDGVYELEFTFEGIEYSVEVDAATGTIIEIEREDEDDDDDDEDDD